MKLGLRRRSVAVLVAALTAVVTGTVVCAPAASASARKVTPPSGFTCYGSSVGVESPRVWTNGTNDPVLWAIHLQRWNGKSWVYYGRYASTAGFTYYGQLTNSWSSAQLDGWGAGTFYPSQRITGDFLGNGQLRLPVRHKGYYQVTSAVVDLQGGVRAIDDVAGGASCYVG